MRILAISGSLRAASSNTALLKSTARLVPDGVEIVLYADLGSLPPFNPDLEDTLPPIVVALRQAVGEADGLLIASPEYAHGVAGSLKNALDWLVASIEFPGKPVALIQATQRAVHADAQLREILTTMSAHLVEAASISLPPSSRLLEEPALAEPLRAALDAFISAVRRSDVRPTTETAGPDSVVRALTL